MIPKTRLGKRSPLGALLCPSLDGALEVAASHRDSGGGHPGSPLGNPQPLVNSLPHLGTALPLGRVKLHPGQKVYVLCAGRECCGVVEQHNHIDNLVSIVVPVLGQHITRKIEDVWISPCSPSAPSSSSSTPSPSSSAPSCCVPAHSASTPHPVSSCIDVPKSYHSADNVDMDEMMAAMVLTSLSCSPGRLQSPPQRDVSTTGTECGGGELSDSGSGYWSLDCGNGSPTPSPPITESEGSLATPPDEGLDMELEQVLFDEPAPRKRRNSVKIAYRCLWPSCGKILISVVGIKRHIRTLHLGQSGDHERCSRSEEDFYYTEIHQRDPLPLTPPPQSAPWSACTSPSIPCSPGLDSPAVRLPQPSPLSQSAPSSCGVFWQVQTEHSYQAPPPVKVVTPTTPSPASCSWTNPIAATQCGQAESFRVRSVSVGEQWLQQNSAPCRPYPAGASPPRSHWATKKGRNEAKKCRKVYGMEHKDQWCTSCRWKKACQRFGQD